MRFRREVIGIVGGGGGGCRFARILFGGGCQVFLVLGSWFLVPRCLLAGPVTVEGGGSRSGPAGCASGPDRQLSLRFVWVQNTLQDKSVRLAWLTEFVFQPADDIGNVVPKSPADIARHAVDLDQALLESRIHFLRIIADERFEFAQS